MTRLRRHIALHRAWAFWLVALALAVRVVVPMGYMPDVRDGQVTVRLCDGAGPVPMALAMPGMDHHKQQHQHDESGQVCAFAGATIAAVDTIATIALTVPIVPVALARRIALPRSPPPAGARRLRPPSQAPPAHA